MKKFKNFAFPFFLIPTFLFSWGFTFHDKMSQVDENLLEGDLSVNNAVGVAKSASNFRDMIPALTKGSISKITQLKSGNKIFTIKMTTGLYRGQEYLIYHNEKHSRLSNLIYPNSAIKEGDIVEFSSPQPIFFDQQVDQLKQAVQGAITITDQKQRVDNGLNSVTKPDCNQNLEKPHVTNYSGSGHVIYKDGNVWDPKKSRSTFEAVLPDNGAPQDVTVVNNQEVYDAQLDSELEANLEIEKLEAQKKQGDLDKSRAIKAGSGIDVLMKKSDAAIAESNFEMAVSLLDRAVRLAPRNPQIYLKLAEVHSFKGNKKQAYTFAKKALVLSPDAITKTKLQIIEEKYKAFDDLKSN
jgi:tetratricopeptide (TPR) repeat protein